jgi:hypothetical protein
MEPRHLNDLCQLKLRNKIRFLLFLYWLRFQERQEQFRRSQRLRAQSHWLGGQDGRGPRLEHLAVALWFLVAMVTLEAYDYLFWIIALGGALSLFLTLMSLYQLIPRKRAPDRLAERRNS